MSRLTKIADVVEQVGNYLLGKASPPQDDNTLKVATTAWLHSLFNGAGKQSLVAASGYQKLPGGLIIQWGNTVIGANIYDFTVNHAVTFPNGTLIAIGMDYGPAATANAINWYSSTTTTSRFNVNNGVQISGFAWLVIGY